MTDLLPTIPEARASAVDDLAAFFAARREYVVATVGAAQSMRRLAGAVAADGHLQYADRLAAVADQVERDADRQRRDLLTVERLRVELEDQR